MRPFLIVIQIMLLAMVVHDVSAQVSYQGVAVESTSSGTINWTAGEVIASGIGAPPARSMNAAQSRAMTERAAYVVALRNLLETVKGVRVDSETIVDNYLVKSDVIKTRVDGIVRGARIIKTQHLSDGSVEVMIAISLRGPLLDAIVPDSFGKTGVPQTRTPPLFQKPKQLPSQPAPAVPSAPAKQLKPRQPQPRDIIPLPEPEKKSVPSMQPEPAVPSRENPSVEFKGGVATGLVIDGRGLGLRPALLPKIVDADGKEVYVGQVVTRTNAVEQGVAGYARDVNAATNNFRVTDNPAVIKGLRSAGPARTDVVIAKTDARMLSQLGDRGDFLQYCRVIIVY